MGQIKKVGTLSTGPGGMYSDIYMDDKINRCPERLSLNGTDKKGWHSLDRPWWTLYETTLPTSTKLWPTVWRPASDSSPARAVTTTGGGKCPPERRFVSQTECTVDLFCLTLPAASPSPHFWYSANDFLLYNEAAFAVAQVVRLGAFWPSELFTRVRSS